MKKVVLGLMLAALVASVTPALAASKNAKKNEQPVITAATATAGTGTAVAQISTPLKRGSKGALVALLQAVLAKDPSLFSSTDIDGSFGAKTQAAVRKYQAKHGLPTVGAVGPQTLAIVNQDLSTEPVEVQTDATGKDCVTIPPGHLIAPGLLKKFGYTPPTIPSCQTLPPGILKKLNGGQHPTGNPNGDITAPVITNNRVTSVSTTAATLTFTTNEDTVYQIAYGTSTSYFITTPKTTTYTRNQTYVFSGLTASTTYHYKITVFDNAGNTTSTTDRTFQTASSDTTAPTISAVTATAVTSTGATISWTTDEPATTELAYGTTTAYGSNSTDTALVVAHSRVLTGLTPDTTYHFMVTSKDGANNASSSNDMTFKTAVAPVISSIGTSAISATTATVSFTTSVPTTAKVYYSATTPVSKATASTATDTTVGTNHALALSGLTANTKYYYLVEVTDTSSDTVTSTEGTFTTTS